MTFNKHLYINRFRYYSFLVFLLIVLQASFSKAQYSFKIFAPNPDTIYPKLNAANKYELMACYNNLSFFHSFNSPDSAIYYAEKVFALEEKKSDEIARATAYRNLGNAYSHKAEYGRAAFNLNQAAKIFETENAYRNLGFVYFDLGKLNYDLDDYDRAIMYSNKLVKLNRENSTDKFVVASPLELAIILGATGGAAREKGDYKLAIDYFYKYIELNNKYEFPYRLNAIWYLSLANAYEFDKQHDSALRYYYMGRSFYPYNQGKAREEQTGYESRIGDNIFRNGDINLGIRWMKKGLAEEISENAYRGVIHTTANLGDAYIELGNTDSALFFYRKRLKYADSMYIENFAKPSDTSQPIVYGGYQYFFNLNTSEVRLMYYSIMINSYEKLYKLFLHMDDSAKALIYLQKKLPYIDSIGILKKDIEMNKVQSMYETDRLEQQVSELSKENEVVVFRLQRNQLIIWFILIISLLVLIIGFFFIRQNQVKTQHEKLVVEQKLLRSQMNPHFIFNSLASIQNFIVKQDDTSASIYLSRFSELIRSILHQSRSELINIEEELNTIENYLSLQKIRFPDEFDYRIEVDEELDIENIYIPPMLTQPFIENAIEHGFKHKTSKGHISVRFKNQNDKLILEIEDDGIGREKAMELMKQQNQNHKSLATEITRQRINAINNKVKKRIHFEIIDIKGMRTTGTKVLFEIPLPININ